MSATVYGPCPLCGTYHEHGCVQVGPAMSDKATPLRKLAPAPTQAVWTSTTEAPCRDKDHEPDKRGLAPGRYEWTCPTCGKVTVFDVQGPGVFL